ncbi:MAG: hypothetical protein GC145_19065 [Caulobacter sp.]|nr:hypothetical protein [Caulobacter sp.]
MAKLAFGVVFVFIGLLAFVAVGRGVWSGRLPVFFTSRPDIVRAEQPTRFWTQVFAVVVCGLIVLVGGLLLMV